MLLPWMILSGVSILWCIISIIVCFAMPLQPGVFNWGQIGSLLVSILITIYFEIVVLSLHNKFNDYDPAPQITWSQCTQICIQWSECWNSLKEKSWMNKMPYFVVDIFEQHQKIFTHFVTAINKWITVNDSK